MFLAGNRSHAIHLFVSASVLPLNMLYLKQYVLLCTTYPTRLALLYVGCVFL